MKYLLNLNVWLFILLASIIVGILGGILYILYEYEIKINVENQLEEIRRKEKEINIKNRLEEENHNQRKEKVILPIRTCIGEIYIDIND